MNDDAPSRLSRLTAILTYLQTKNVVPASAMALQFSVSVRTIYRDIRSLEEAGIPIGVEDGKGYFLMDGYKLPPVMFTENEANALITAEQLILKNKDASFVKNYTDAILKIKSVLQSNTKDKAELLSKRIVFRQNLSNDTTSDYLASIQMALTNFNLCQIEYFTLDKQENTIRTIEPFAVYNTQENWILIAFCRLRQEFRAFRLDRILALDVSSAKFEKHNLSLQEYFEICKQKSFPAP